MAPLLCLCMMYCICVGQSASKLPLDDIKVLLSSTSTPPEVQHLGLYICCWRHVKSQSVRQRPSSHAFTVSNSSLTFLQLNGAEPLTLQWYVM